MMEGIFSLTNQKISRMNFYLQYLLPILYLIGDWMSLQFSTLLSQVLETTWLLLAPQQIYSQQHQDNSCLLLNWDVYLSMPEVPLAYYCSVLKQCLMIILSDNHKIWVTIIIDIWCLPFQLWSKKKNETALWDKQLLL